MKRILALLLALLVAAPLAACSGGTPDTPSDTTDTAAPDTEPAETEPPRNEDGLLPADFEGAAYKIASTGGDLKFVAAEEMNGETVNDAEYVSARRVEGRYNVTITEEAASDGGSDFITNLVASGETEYSICLGFSGTANLVKAGALYNLKDIPQFDFDAPWWTNGITEAVTIGHEKAYLAINLLSYRSFATSFFMVINKDFADKYNLTVPYQDIYDGTWTMDKCLAMAKVTTNDIDGDGKMTAADDWGVSYRPRYFRLIQSSQDVYILSKDEDNVPYINFDLERAQVYHEKMDTLLHSYGYDENKGYSAGHFLEGHSLFIFLTFLAAEDFRNSDMHYGFLILPKLDENQKDYISTTTGITWVIPVTVPAENIDMIGTVSESLSYEGYTNVTPAYFETLFQGKLSDAPDDTRVLGMIRDTLRCNYNDYRALGAGALRNLVDEVELGTIASTWESLKDTIAQNLAAEIAMYIPQQEP